MEARP